MVMQDERNEALVGAAGLPSILELIARDRLSISIEQALRYIVKYLYESNPSRYKLLWEWYDEIYVFADLILQSFYLKKYGGSLAENFYGMKRIINGTCRTASAGFPKLRSLFMLKLSSLVEEFIFVSVAIFITPKIKIMITAENESRSLVIWPYIMKKLEKLHLLLSSYMAVGNSRQFSLIRMLVNFYPWIKILFSTFAFLLKIGYILSLCDVHSPELKFANVHLVKLTGIDFDEGSKMRTWRALTIFASILTRCVTFGLYCIQFLDFYYNSDTGDNFRMEQRIKNWKYPPAPHKKLRESSVLLLEANKCPLCLRQRANDTVLAVSGYVFCYGCIYSYVEQKKKCPVTGLPANVDDLIKIFVPSACT